MKPKKSIKVTAGQACVLEIIKACKEAGVSSFKNGAVEILFGNEPLEAGPVYLKSQAETKTDSVLREPEQMPDDEKFTLMLADPLSFEEQMMKENDG